MTYSDPYEHLEEAWGLEDNPFPQNAISASEDDPWVDLFPDETRQFFSKFVRGGVRSGLSLGYLWSQGLHADTGFGKTRLMRHARNEINRDFGNTVLSGMRSERRPPVASAYTSLNTTNNTGLYAVLFSGAADLANDYGEEGSVYDRARRLIVEKLAREEGVDPTDVAPEMVAADVRMARLKTAPGGTPLREALVEAFAGGEGRCPRPSARSPRRPGSGAAWPFWTLPSPCWRQPVSTICFCSWTSLRIWRRTRRSAALSAAARSGASGTFRNRSLTPVACT